MAEPQGFEVHDSDGPCESPFGRWVLVSDSQARRQLSSVRILVLNANAGMIGGVESYLAALIPALKREGHSVAAVFELEPAPGRGAVAPPSIDCWISDRSGIDQCVAEARRWAPDLIYSQGTIDPQLESKVAQVAPTIAFAHNYYGTCVSGTKTWRLPRTRPSDCTFSAKCLLHYYPRRCGGLSPLTLIRQYQLQRDRLELYRRLPLVLTASQHMRREYLRHGLATEQVRCVPYPLASPLVERASPVTVDDEAIQLHFIGRMDPLKGGLILIQALAEVASQLDRDVVLQLAGDGPDRQKWESAATALMQHHSRVRVEFVGWVTAERRAAFFADAHLLVVPSLWPEPFGLVGPEAGLFGVPAVAFNVGGVADWLEEGVNGHTASGDPPTKEGLAAAIVTAARDPKHLELLRAGATRLAGRYTMAAHLLGLQAAFEAALAGRAFRPESGASTDAG